MSEDKAATAEDDRAGELKAKRAGIIDALRGDPDEPDHKATPDRVPAKETVPAE